MELLPLSNFIEYRNEFITIEDAKEYNRITAKLHRRGLVLRDIIKGSEIKVKKQQICKIDQLLVAEIDAKVGGYGIVPRELEGAIVSSHYFLFDINHDRLLPEYLAYILKTDGFFSQIKAQGSTNYAAIRPKDVLKIKIPYCSTNLQRNLVDKFDGITKKTTLLGKNILRVSDCTSKLREGILQEAISGKLVPQNPNDEPALELLKKIKTEKEQLIQSKKIKKEKDLPPILEEEIPYELPKGWIFARLGELVHFNPRNYLDDDTEVSFVPMRLIEDGYKNQHSFEVRKWCEIKSGYTHFHERDIALAKITPCFENRKSAIMSNLKNRYGAGTTELIIMRTFEELVLPEFLLFLVKTNGFIKVGISSFTGTAGQQRIKPDAIRNFVMGLPPLPEQERIVKKVNYLNGLLDSLKDRVETEQRDSEFLIPMVLKETFGS